MVRWNSLVGIGKRAVREYQEDDGVSMAAALAFGAFFSLFPLVLLLVSLATLVVQPADAQRWVLQNVQILQLQPDQVNLFQQTIIGIMKARGAGTGIAAVVGFLGLLLGASGVFGTLQTAINRAWNCEGGTNLIRDKILDFLMVLGLAAILLLSTGLSAVLTALQAGSAGLLGVHPLAWQIVNLLVTTTLIAGIVAVLFRTLPRGHVGWREVWPGALLTAVLWALLREGFAIYLGNFANFQAVYGALGSIIALQTWIFLSAQILLFCAELTSEYGRELRTPGASRPAADPAPPAA